MLINAFLCSVREKTAIFSVVEIAINVIENSSTECIVWCYSHKTAFIE